MSLPPLASNDSVVYIVDDEEALILAENQLGRSQPLHEFGNLSEKDILKQAFEEVTSSSVTSEQSAKSKDDAITLYFDATNEKNVLEALSASEPSSSSNNVAEEEILTLVRAEDGSLQFASPMEEEAEVSTSAEGNKTGLPDVVNNRQVTSSNGSGEPSLLLVPTTGADGKITYVLQTAQPLQQNSKNNLNISKKTSRPSIIGKKQQRPPLTASQMLAASNARSGLMPKSRNSESISKPTRSYPLILPKPSVPKVIPTSAEKTDAAQLNEFQFVQKGSAFHTKQSLTNVQLTQVAKTLRASEKEVSSNPETRIVVEKESGEKVIYSVLYPEDIPKSKKQPSDDEVEEGSVQVEEYFPHELFSKAFLKKYQMKRRRGRPTKEEVFTIQEKPEIHEKKLRKEFGLSSTELQAVSKDIVSDREAKLENAKSKLAEDENDQEVVEEIEAEHNDENYQQISRTRSGRMSKPPAPKDATVSVIDKLKRVERPPEESEPRPKRRFHIPERFRCRVCHKIYLGDRKMNRHMRLFPSHGPPLQPPPPAATYET